MFLSILKMQVAREAPLLRYQLGVRKPTHSGYLFIIAQPSRLRVTDSPVRLGALSFPSPLPSPLGRGSKVLRLSITPVPEFAQRPSAGQQPDACCSLSLGRGSG